MPDTLRVLHLSTWNVPCGIASYCANLVKSLDAAGVMNDVFPLHPHEWQSYLPGDVRQFMERVRIKARDYDLVHIQHEHGLFGQGMGMSFTIKRFGEVLDILKQENKPVVTTFHTELRAGSRRLPHYLQKAKDWLRTWKWRRHVVRHFNETNGHARAIVHTAKTRFIFARSGIDPAAIHMVPHGCLPKRELDLDNKTAKEKLGIPPTASLLTIFGFVGAYKGHDIALEALKRLPEKYHLAIVGGAHPESRDHFLDDLLTKIGKKLRPRVTVTGYVERETADLYYAATDICLAPYRADVNLSASGAIMWALSSGKPTIASKIDAFEPTRREADCFMSVTAGLARELAWAVEKLDGDKPLQQKLVTNALRYNEQHSWPKTALAHVEIYEQILGRTARRTAGDHECDLALPRAA